MDFKVALDYLLKILEVLKNPKVYNNISPILKTIMKDYESFYKSNITAIDKLDYKNRLYQLFTSRSIFPEPSSSSKF